VSVITGGSSYTRIASALGKGLKPTDIGNKRCRELKESSGIIKPPVQAGRDPHSYITCTAKDVSMICGIRVC
jgi:hypothetical protein